MGATPLPSAIGSYVFRSVAAPAVGSDWTVTVPAGKWWYLFTVYAILTQGLTQTPQPIMFIDDGGANVLGEWIASTAAQAASTTCAYSWAAGNLLTGQVGSGTGVHSNAPIPEGLILAGGYRVRTNTLGIGANSAWNAPKLFVCELG